MHNLERYPENNSFIRRLALSEEAHEEITGNWIKEYSGREHASELEGYSTLLKIFRRGYYSREEQTDKKVYLYPNKINVKGYAENYNIFFMPSGLSIETALEFARACCEAGYIYPSISNGLFYVFDYIMYNMTEKAAKRDLLRDDLKPYIQGFTVVDTHESYEILSHWAQDEIASLDDRASNICKYIDMKFEIPAFSELDKIFNNSTSLGEDNYYKVDTIVTDILSDSRAFRLLMRKEMLDTINHSYVVKKYLT